MNYPKMPGFSDTEFVMGTVRGIRAWQPVMSHSRGGVGGVLYQEVRGIRAEHMEMAGAVNYVWQPGVNVARCQSAWTYATSCPSPKQQNACWRVPNRTCGCGFWAYWHQISGGWGLLAGVIEGFGRTVLGEKGFRCEKARLLGLAVRHESYASNVWSGTPLPTPQSIVAHLARKFEVPCFPDVASLTYQFPPSDGGLIWP